MDRDDLLGLLDLLENKTLKVDVEGYLIDGDDNEISPDRVEAAIVGMESDLAELRKVLAWAKQAPKYPTE